MPPMIKNEIRVLVKVTLKLRQAVMTAVKIQRNITIATTIRKGVVL